MRDEMMYFMRVGFSPEDAVRIHGVFRTAEKAEEMYHKNYESAFPYYSIGSEPIYG